jgi:predicted nucleic acid-binding protein
MYKSIFLDVNIWVDVFDPNRALHTLSYQMLDALIQDEDIELYTSCDMMTTIYYLLSKRDRQDALNAIIHINELCGIIEFGNLEIRECTFLMQSDTKYKDLEDTIQYVMAKKAGCDLILSNDRGFVSPDIALMSTEQFLSLYVAK